MSNGVKKLMSGKKMGKWYFCSLHNHYWYDATAKGSGTEKDAENKNCDVTDEDNADEEK